MATISLSSLFKELIGDETIEELREKLEWERRILYTVLDHLPSSIYVKDHEARKIVANKANYTQAGFVKASDVIGKTDFEMFPRHLAEKFYEDDCKVLKKGETITNRVEQVISTDGVECWIVTDKYPIYDDHGDIVGLFGFGHDITAQKNLEKEKTLASQKIEEQQDMVEQMIVDLSAIPAKIENLVDGIANIAKQTKMVAINAAIEAARVGEYGRGFEIVAREVGQLSDQSQKATIQVREAIEEVNSLVQKILQLWEEVKQEK
ncbi:MAG TPA: PAS domain-containing protein [Firmicutes bacterium]|nr:PAS domain-containing protein [Bacillota bacterium]